MNQASDRPQSYAETFVNEIFPSRYKTGALAGERYTSADFYRREWEAVWTKVWLVTARTVEIPEAGDFVVEEIGPESILVVRQEDGSIKAFYNVCQHRGNRLVHPAEGSMPSFTCDYHSWVWGIDGSLLSAQDEEDFSQGNPCGRVALEELRCDTFAGFVFVNMDPDCIPLKDYLGPVWDRWQVYPTEKMVRVQALTVKLPSNWKALHDNFSEVYHFATVHAPFLDYLEDDFRSLACEIFDQGHTVMHMKGALPSNRYLTTDAPPISEQLAGELRRWDLDPADFADRPTETRRALQVQKRKLGPARGHDHYAAMSDSQLTDSHHYTVFPNFSAGMLADGMLFHRLRPHATDPNVSYYDVFYYATGDDAFSGMSTAKGGSGGTVEDAPREYLEYGERSLGALLDGDVGTMATQQKGLRSRGYRGGELADQEYRLAFYHHMIDRCMAGWRPGQD
ncbi:MAG: Rieske 2Fe-2S domain-containing protein [Alphaproteobacteria bacterium]|nr:Rieske 2Fe-2S domain-containing protein [Alphaproteobacteria bacterium]